MAEHSARAAFVAALTDRRRNGIALAIALAAVASAVAIDTPLAYYGAGLVAFSVYMAWFILAAVEWIGLADF